MEKIPEYVKGNILPAENLNFLEITSFVAPPIASNPPCLLRLRYHQESVVLVFWVLGTQKKSKKNPKKHKEHQNFKT